MVNKIKYSRNRRVNENIKIKQNGGKIAASVCKNIAERFTNNNPFGLSARCSLKSIDIVNDITLKIEFEFFGDSIISGVTMIVSYDGNRVRRNIEEIRVLRCTITDASLFSDALDLINMLKMDRGLGFDEFADVFMFE